jgi:hypothetical protein
MPNIPSRAWFPAGLQDRAAWFDNFASQFSAIGLSLGFTAPQITIVQSDNVCIHALAAGKVTLDAFVDAVMQYRKNVTEGDVGDPTPAFPVAPDITPSELSDTGIFQRLIELVTRIRAAAAYTPEVGALLGIIPSTTGTGANPEDNPDFKPVLKPVTKPGNAVEVGFTRGSTDGIAIEIKIDNEASWSDGGRFFKSPAALNIPDGTGLPRAVQIRARFLSGNNPIGQNSDTVNVVTTP